MQSNGIFNVVRLSDIVLDEVLDEMILLNKMSHKERKSFLKERPNVTNK